MKMMEVRCCCDPVKLLGWLPVSEADLYFSSLQFLTHTSIEVRRRNPIDPVAKVEHITLSIQTFSMIVEGHRVQYQAIADNETPIETLRKIPGFVENKDDQ